MPERKSSPKKPVENPVQALEREWGEPLLFRVTGRILAAQGFPEAPLSIWGLVALTPTRVIFHHYPQTHPLFGGKTEEVRWEAERSDFTSCRTERQGFWVKFLSGVPDHVVLEGPQGQVSLETADDLTGLPQAWSRRDP